VHDVDQKLLKKKLDESAESCETTWALILISIELPAFVSGITSSVAKKH